MTVLVEQPGPRSLLEDAGRPGLGHLGVSPSGAFDRTALRQANLLLGNDPGSTVIEALGGGLVLRAEAATTVAVTGAAGPILVDGALAAYGRAIPLRTGQRLVLGTPATGLRAYVGAAGGFAVTPELGSSSTDTLAGLGPRPLAAGDRLEVGPRGVLPELADVPALGRSGEVSLDVVLGPRDDWFSPGAIGVLLGSAWEVGAMSDRIGVRLAGPRLERSRADELPSEPCVRGSIQVASGGQPIVLGPDHPVTGGYPVIAVVVDSHTDLLAQAAPGQVVRFRRRAGG